MTSYTWKGVSGDWNLASDWTPAGGPPKSTDAATINGTASTTVTIDTADVAQSLTLSDANATLNDDGSSASLTIGGTLAMSNGTLNLSPDGDGGVLTVGALTLSGGALNIDSGGQLNLKGTLSQTGGTLTLDGGTISGGTIKSTTGTLAFTSSGGTLSGVTYDGTLDLSENFVSVHLASGTVVNNAGGTGAGTINDTGYDSTLFFDNTRTLNNATINLGNASGYSYVEEYDTTGLGTVLTLGSSVTINESGYGYIQDSGAAGDGIVNQGAIKQSGTGGYLVFAGNSLTNSGTITGAASGGTLTIEDTTFTNSGTITASASGGTLTIDPTTFTNNGAINISNGDKLTIEPTNFSNAAKGVIAVGADSTLTLAPAGSWSNQGLITLASGASLYLGGSFTLAGLGTLTNSGGTVYIEGTFNNTGGTLNGTNVLGQAVLDGGTVQGGTAAPAGLAFSTGGGTLSGVTFDGTLDLSESGVSVHLASGTVVNNAAGTGAGTINDTALGRHSLFRQHANVQQRDDQSRQYDRILQPSRRI